MNNEGLVFMRQRPCWCLECVAATMKGNLQWRGDSKCVVKCEKYYLLGDKTTNLYDSSKHPCIKTSGPGIPQQIIMDNRNGNKVTIELVVGDWVLYDSMRDDDDNDDDIWLGRVKSKPEWCGKGVWKNDTGGRIERYGILLVAN